MNNDKLGPEIEVKIIDIGDSIDFAQRILDHGGERLRGPFIIHDFAFHHISGTVGSVIHVPMRSTGAISYPHFAEVIMYLGFMIVPEGKDLRLLLPLQPPDRSVRLRKDGRQLLFTVKEQPEVRGEIARRHEVEAVLSQDCFSEVLAMLVMAGYHPKHQRQKRRVCFRVGPGYVELNRSPLPNVPPWIEIEAHSEADVVAIAAQLGFSSAHFLNLSDTELFMQFGYEKNELKRVLF